MTKHLVLFSRGSNENSDTPADPISPVVKIEGPIVTYRTAKGEEKMANLTAVHWACLYWDDDRLVPVATYDVCEVELPDWLSVERWIENWIDWKWTWGAGVSQDWSEQWQRSLLGLSFSHRYITCGLLKQKSFKSDFRRKLRDQIVAWLDTAPEDRQYPESPLSDRQWACLRNVYVNREIKQMDEALYQAKGSYGTRYETIHEGRKYATFPPVS